MLETTKISTAKTLARDFRALGVEPGDIIMLHAAYRSVRPVEGGPEAVLDGLLDALSPSGTIVMFASWAHSTYDAFAKGGLSAADRAAWPGFDASNAPVKPTHAGAIGACLARRSAVVRSPNPDRSLLGLGPAAHLLKDHSLLHGFGHGSPLEALIGRGAKTLNLGAPLGTATIVHYAEYLADVPHKRYVSYEIPIQQDGQTVWHQTTQMNRDAFVAAGENLDPSYIEQVIRAYLETGRHAQGAVGGAQAYLFDMADLVPFAVRQLESRFG